MILLFIMAINLANLTHTKLRSHGHSYDYNWEAALIELWREVGEISDIQYKRKLVTNNTHDISELFQRKNRWNTVDTPRYIREYFRENISKLRFTKHVCLWQMLPSKESEFGPTFQTCPNAGHVLTGVTLVTSPINDLRLLYDDTKVTPLYDWHNVIRPMRAHVSFYRRIQHLLIANYNYTKWHDHLLMANYGYTKLPDEFLSHSSLPTWFTSWEIEGTN